eukprot:582559_1
MYHAVLNRSHGCSRDHYKYEGFDCSVFNKDCLEFTAQNCVLCGIIVLVPTGMTIGGYYLLRASDQMENDGIDWKFLGGAILASSLSMYMCSCVTPYFIFKSKSRDVDSEDACASAFCCGICCFVVFFCVFAFGFYSVCEIDEWILMVAIGLFVFAFSSFVCCVSLYLKYYQEYIVFFRRFYDPMNKEFDELFHGRSNYIKRMTYDVQFDHILTHMTREYYLGEDIEQLIYQYTNSQM